MDWHPAQDLGSLIIGLDADADFFPYLPPHDVQSTARARPTRIVDVDQSFGNATPTINPGPFEEAATASTDTNKVPLMSLHV